MPRIRGTKEEIADKKRQFGMWLGLPKEAREPSAQVDLAKKLGVSETTLAHWRNDDEVKKAKESAVKVLGGNDMYDIVKSLTMRAKEGSFQHQRLYMEWQGQIGGKQGNKPEPVELIVRHGTKERSID